MFSIRIAELNIGINNKCEYVERFCRDYIIGNDEPLDFSVDITENDIDAEVASSTINVSRGYAESICVYREICDKVLRDHNGLLFHSAVIEKDGKGYAFSAKSGTGKSTHISLWKKAFGDSVHVVNGDKPIVRDINGEFLAFGTPWCGKERYGTNTCVPLSAICFIERSKENTIKKLSADDAVSRVFTQILFPSDIECFEKTAAFLDKMLKVVPCYLLGCNMDIEAAHVAYNGMN